MWWVLGVAAIVVVAFLFTRFRAASHQVQLIQTGRNHLWQSFRLLKNGSDRVFDRDVDERVWRDPYLLGYAQGSLAMMTTFYGKKLKTEQKGMVTVRVLQDMAGERWKEVCERIEILSGRRDPEFARGMQNGSDVTILMTNRAGPDLLADPDVQLALRQAPEQAQLAERLLGPMETGQSGAAGAVLMREYMERHKREAGY